MDIGFSKRRVAGFTLVELIVVIALLAVVGGMLLPNLVRAPNSHRIKCVNNLKNIGLGFRIFAVDNQDRFPMEVSTNKGGSLEFVNDGTAIFRHFVALSNELSTPLLLVCPNDTRRKAATNFLSVQQANLSYFIGLNADRAYSQGADAFFAKPCNHADLIEIARALQRPATDAGLVNAIDGPPCVQTPPELANQSCCFRNVA